MTSNYPSCDSYVWDLSSTKLELERESIDVTYWPPQKMAYISLLPMMLSLSVFPTTSPNLELVGKTLNESMGRGWAYIIFC